MWMIESSKEETLVINAVRHNCPSSVKEVSEGSPLIRSNNQSVPRVSESYRALGFFDQEILSLA